MGCNQWVREDLNQDDNFHPLMKNLFLTAQNHRTFSEAFVLGTCSPQAYISDLISLKS